MAVPSAEKTGFLTERDLEISAWVERLLGASACQIGRRFGLGRTQLYQRLRVLQAYGLLSRRRLIVGQPALDVVKGRGRDLRGSLMKAKPPICRRFLMGRGGFEPPTDGL
jgi:hypothetical protein